jgi:ATP-dependent Lhr-like helicase
MIDWPEGLKGASFARKPGNYLLLKGDRWLYWIENNGRRVFNISESEADAIPLDRQAALLHAAFQSIIRRQRLVKITVDLWNGETVTETEAGRILLKLGAERDLRSLVFWSK